MDPSPLPYGGSTGRVTNDGKHQTIIVQNLKEIDLSSN